MLETFEMFGMALAFGIGIGVGGDLIPLLATSSGQVLVASV
jgi:hypothetical protein